MTRKNKNTFLALLLQLMLFQTISQFISNKVKDNKKKGSFCCCIEYCGMCAMIAFSRVFLSFISAFSDNNLGNCTEIPVVAKHRIYQSVAPFFIPKDSPLNR